VEVGREERSLRLLQEIKLRRMNRLEATSIMRGWVFMTNSFT
jgi:hypothetical protein